MTETDDYPAYTTLREGLDEATVGETPAPVGTDTPEPDHDILEMIKDGRVASFVSDGNLVLTLAGHGHSIETTADALDKSLDEVEALADMERAKLAERLSE